MRTTVSLTSDQLLRLDEVAALEHISRAEAVRRAIDIAYPQEDVRQAVTDIRQRAFGLWQRRKLDAVEYVDALRDE